MVYDDGVIARATRASPRVLLLVALAGLAAIIVLPCAYVVRLLTTDLSAVAIGSVETVPLAAEFRTLFPDARAFISYYSGHFGSPTLSWQAGLHDRYIVVMKVQIDVDRLRGRVTRATGAPTFFVTEVTGVGDLPSGQTVITYGGVDLSFGVDEWGQLVASDGDLAALGIEVVEDNPVPGFERALHP